MGKLSSSEIGYSLFQRSRSVFSFNHTIQNISLPVTAAITSKNNSLKLTHAMVVMLRFFEKHLKVFDTRQVFFSSLVTSSKGTEAKKMKSEKKVTFDVTLKEIAHSDNCGSKRATHQCCRSGFTDDDVYRDF